MKKTEIVLGRILRDLTELRKVRGRAHGRARLDAELGKSSTHMSRLLSGKSGLRIDEFIELNQAMGTDPAEVLGSALSGFNPEVYLAELERTDPGKVRYVRSDLLGRPPAEEHPVEVLRQKADALEELRLLDAAAAKEDALEILRTARRWESSSTPRAANPRRPIASARRFAPRGRICA